MRTAYQALPVQVTGIARATLTMLKKLAPPDQCKKIVWENGTRHPFGHLWLIGKILAYPP